MEEALASAKDAALSRGGISLAYVFFLIAAVPLVVVSVARRHLQESHAYLLAARRGPTAANGSADPSPLRPYPPPL